MLPFQKINIADMQNYIGSDGRINSVLSICGFLLCKKGWVKVRLNDSTYTIREGDMYIYVSSTFIHVVAWSQDIEGIIFKSSLDYIMPFVERAAAQKVILSIRTNPCVTLNASQQANVEEIADLLDRKMHIFTQMEEDCTQRKFMMRELECLAEALFTELFLCYTDNQTALPEKATHKDKIIYQFIACLFKNYKREREVKFYAEQQFLTARYFSTIIKERTGKTALNWISEMVISNACQLLTYTDMTIKEIALDMNFPTQSFFGKYFKQYMHCSPNQYRVQQQRFMIQENIPEKAPTLVG